MRRNGFSEEDLRARGNELRQHSAANTARALKEHFILERIGEDEKIEAEQADYDLEVALIAQQTEESPRRVRARLEKEGLMDALRNQIIERKVIELVLESAKFKDVPYSPPDLETEAIDHAVGGEEQEESTTDESAEASSAKT
jgi:trigger factor